MLYEPKKYMSRDMPLHNSILWAPISYLGHLSTGLVQFSLAGVTLEGCTDAVTAPYAFAQVIATTAKIALVSSWLQVPVYSADFFFKTLHSSGPG